MTLATGWAGVCGVFLTVLEDYGDDIFLRYHALNVRLCDAPCETGALGKTSTLKRKSYTAANLNMIVTCRFDTCCLRVVEMTAKFVLLCTDVIVSPSSSSSYHLQNKK